MILELLSIIGAIAFAMLFVAIIAGFMYYAPPLVKGLAILAFALYLLGGTIYALWQPPVDYPSDPSAWSEQYR